MALAKKKEQKEESVMMGAKKVRMVRGGGICGAEDMKAGHAPALVKGSMQSAQCRPTVGPDPRPRWRVAGKM
jgi:hypothetical protein